MANNKLHKARQLLQIISDKKPLAVLTVDRGQWYHQGKPITEDERAQVIQSHERTITINIIVKQ